MKSVIYFAIAIGTTNASRATCIRSLPFELMAVLRTGIAASGRDGISYRLALSPLERASLSTRERGRDDGGL